MEKRQTFQWTKDFGLLFLLLSNITKIRNFFWGTTRFVWHFFAIDKSLSLGPKRSIARTFSKISCSHGDRSFWLNFHRLITCDKPPGTVCKCPQSLLTFTVEVMRSFLQDLRGCWKNNFSKKRQSFQWGKNYGSLFLVLSSMTNLKGQFVTVFKVFWPLLSLLYDEILGPRRLFNSQIIGKKADFPVKKRFWPFFLIFSNITKIRNFFLRDHKVRLTFFCKW